jgi:hypothetical protein
MYLTSAVNSSVHGCDLIDSYSHSNSPVWDSVVELFNYCARAAPSKALRADILSLLLPEVFRLYQGYPDDLFFEFVHLLLSSLETPVRHPSPQFHFIFLIPYRQESNPSFHHHVNLFDDLLRPIVRSYYSSPQLTLLLTFLYKWKHGNFYPTGVDNAPYLLPSSKVRDAEELKLTSWFYGYYHTRQNLGRRRHCLGLWRNYPQFS